MAFPIEVTLVVFSFLCGSIPTGYLLIKISKQQDIRTIGSGNIGSTNVRRAGGFGLSLATQAIDILKGLIPVGITWLLSQTYQRGEEETLLVAAVALASILGHDFSPFLGFRGGKGVNTTLGAFLLLAPLAVMIGIAVYTTLRLLTLVVSIRSLTLGVAIPIAAWITGSPPPITAALWMAALLIFIRHIENIRRLFTGREI
jgi:acyl phosphate:glycerol-3-phosphate acyltransferase